MFLVFLQFFRLQKMKLNFFFSGPLKLERPEMDNFNRNVFCCFLSEIFNGRIKKSAKKYTLKKNNALDTSNSCPNSSVLRLILSHISYIITRNTYPHRSANSNLNSNLYQGRYLKMHVHNWSYSQSELWNCTSNLETLPYYSVHSSIWLFQWYRLLTRTFQSRVTHIYPSSSIPIRTNDRKVTRHRRWQTRNLNIFVGYNIICEHD